MRERGEKIQSVTANLILLSDFFLSFLIFDKFRDLIRGGKKPVVEKLE